MEDRTLVSALIGAITVLAGVVAYLFKLYVARNKEISAREDAMAEERKHLGLERAKIVSDHRLEIERLQAQHELEEEQTRTDFEKRHRELVERYDAAARRESDIFRAHADQVRKDFADVMEKVAVEASKQSASLAAALQKIYDRFIGPRHY